MQTTAKVIHRDERLWPGPKGNGLFCLVSFYGARAEEMEEKWIDITQERFMTYHCLYTENEIKIRNLHDKAGAIYKQVKDSVPFYRFWYNKAEKEMLFEANKLSNHAHELEEENEKLGELRFFGVYECHSKIEAFLEENGFVLTTSTSPRQKDLDYGIATEVWTLE